VIYSRNYHSNIGVFFMKFFLTILLILTVPMNALAVHWTASQKGGKWFTRTGNFGKPNSVWVEVKNERQAKKTAEILNEIDAADANEESGDNVYDDGRGNCDRPGINC